MAEHIERYEDCSAKEISKLKKQGYLSAYDPDFEESYLYDPTHWELIPDGERKQFDYIFDNLTFKSLTQAANELAKSEGYGMPMWEEEL